MKPIILGTAFGSRLNLNGDQGNLLALKRYLVAAGFEVEIRSANTTQAMLESDFVLVGHGSKAAMASIETQLEAIDWTAVKQQVPGLVVGSSFEWLAEHSQVTEMIARGDRVSQFEVGSLGTIRALGYRNTDSGLPNLVASENLICTMLHGPVFAKNPKLVDLAARAAVRSARLEWPASRSHELGSWIETLNRVCGQIWQLEAAEELPAL